METIQDRIIYIIENFYNNNGSLFCRESDISQGTLSHIIKGRKSDPSFDMLVKIILNIKLNVNPDWLILGTGEIQRQDHLLDTQSDISSITQKKLNQEMQLQKDYIESLKEIIIMKNEKIYYLESKKVVAMDAVIVS